jgi:hypothetical protein
MATQSDLDKMRKKLSDLDAKLKSMRGNQKAPVARPSNFVDMGRSVPRRPIDMVRDPGFGSAMANQDYENRMREAFARLAAERGGAGAVIDRPPTLAGSILNPEILNKAKEEYLNQNPGDPNKRVKADLIDSRYLGQIGRTMAGFDNWFRTNYINNPNSPLSAQERMTLDPRMGAPTNQPRPSDQDFIDNRDPNKATTMDMVDYIDPATGEKTSRTRGVVPAPGSRFVPANQAGMYGQRSEIEGRNAALDAALNQYRQGMFTPTPQGPQVGGGMGERMPTPIPEAPQGQQAAMAAYNNFLQQGIQNSNTLNQGAMASFANTQPGMQVPQVPQAGAQIPQPTIAKPQRPSMVTQQRRPFPAPRKFSTVRNTPARFG